MCEERDSKYFEEDKEQPKPEFNTPRRVKKNKFLKKSNSAIEEEPSRNFKLSKTQSNISTKYKKTISFNMNDVPESKPKIIREESKSSKSREEKKTKTKAKPCEFIPIRESQLNNSMLL